MCCCYGGMGKSPYDWISDNTRWTRKSRSYRGIDHFLQLTIDTYRRDLWASGDVHVEVWIEKDALAGVVMEETESVRCAIAGGAGLLLRNVSI